jgi:hypothetical protein
VLGLTPAFRGSGQDRPVRTPRRSIPRTLALATVWLAGVAVATAVGFQAAHRVGIAVSDTAAAPLPEAEAAASAVRLGATPAAPTGHIGPLGPTSAGPSPTPSPASASPPSASPASPSAAHTTTAGPPPATTAAAVPVTRSFEVRGGVVAVRCTGARIALLYAVPAAGFASTVTDRGPEQVEVEFAGNPAGAHLQAFCVAGRPVARVEGDE